MLSLMLALLAAPVPAEATAAEKYETAVIAAIHLFARLNEAEHLDALLEKHPKLVDVLERFPQPRKPSLTDSFTPLHWAARCGNARAASILLKHRANLSADSGGGWTPLHVAAEYGRLEVAKMLVDLGAKTNAKTEAQPERIEAIPSLDPLAENRTVKVEASPAETPLDVAIRFKKQDVAEYLKSQKK